MEYEQAAGARASQDEAAPAFEAAMEDGDAPEADIEADIGAVAGRRDSGSAEPDATYDAEPSVRGGLPGSAWLALLALALGFLAFLAFLFLRPRG
jgi:hypothetical protein